MKLLIDIGHPAHVHLYRHFIREMKKRGHEFIVTVKDFLSAKQLLGKYAIPFRDIGGKSDSLAGKAARQFNYNRRLLRQVKDNSIDVVMGTSITVAHVSKMTAMKSVVFDDDDDAVEPIFSYLAHPFVDYLLSPDVLAGKRRKKRAVFYAGYHELAYLHPKRFTPDPSVLYEVGLTPGDKFFILRFNAFKAHHDAGILGISLDDKRRLVNGLAKKGRVLITMERELEPEFEPFRLNISPEKAHSLMYYSTMLVGDSQTMTSEAAVLGTPAMKCNSFAGRLTVPNELEIKYQLCFAFSPSNVGRMFVKIDELLAQEDLKAIWAERRDRMLKDKIDVTSFMVWFVENLPESAEIMRRDPDFHYQFK